MGFWDKKKVLVAGGAGFIGSHVVEELLRRGSGVRVSVADRLTPRRLGHLKAVRKDIKICRTDFLSAADCLKACKGQDVVLNLAARVAGVGYNSEHPGTMFRDNMAMFSNLIEAARVGGAQRFLVVSSACVYPREAKAPTGEDQGFVGLPEPTSEGYGWAKRMSEYLGQAYSREFGMKVAIARPSNAYGPRDAFDSPHAHVVASLISRAVRGENPVVVWGDGARRRTFMYVEDIARGLLDVTERYAAADPVNLGTDEEVTIAHLVETIVELAGSKAKIKYDASKPMGQDRRYCSTAKAKKAASFVARVSLREGLRRTIQWYRASR
jgi:nucleoside-diphosphate-sugar epimerase